MKLLLILGALFLVTGCSVKKHEDCFAERFLYSIKPGVHYDIYQDPKDGVWYLNPEDSEMKLSPSDKDFIDKGKDAVKEMGR
jgi:hypothetical protein